MATKDRRALVEEIFARFNEKVTKSQSEGPQPKKRKVEDYMPYYEQLPSGEFRREMTRLQRYLRPGMESTVETRGGKLTSLWEYLETENIVKTLNRRNKRVIDEYEPNTYKGTMGTVARGNLKERVNRVDRVRDVSEYFLAMERQLLGSSASVRNAKYKENFLHAIKTQFGETSELYQKIKDEDAADLYRYYHEDAILSISFTSDPLPPDVVQQAMLDELELLHEEDKRGYDKEDKKDVEAAKKKISRKKK